MLLRSGNASGQADHANLAHDGIPYAGRAIFVTAIQLYRAIPVRLMNFGLTFEYRFIVALK